MMKELDRVQVALLTALLYITETTPNGQSFLRQFEFEFRDVMKDINEQPKPRKIGFIHQE